MSISTCARIIVPVMTVLIACDRGPTAHEKHANAVESLGQVTEYNAAVKAVEANKPAGLLKIYEISVNSKSAELSEVARDKLCELIITKTELWVKTFSKIDQKNFQNYLINGGMAPIDLPSGINSQSEYSAIVRTKLHAYHWSTKENELVVTIDETLNLKP